jgi:CRP-like cAMP-binding protein
MAPGCFYIITKGLVEVVIPGSDGDEIVAATMGPGQFFGEIELRRGGHNIATVRADRVQGVEVAALEREAFERLLAESAATREAIDRTVAERMAEHAAAEAQGSNGHA